MPHAKEQWPIIRPRKNNLKAIISYMVDCGMMNGQRVRFFFKTKVEAETKQGLMRVKRANEGESAFGMSANTRADANAALELLGLIASP